MDGDTLVRGVVDELYEISGDNDVDVLDVALLELVSEALSVDSDESEALTFAEEEGVDVSEGDILGWIEEETAADDDILADEDVLDVGDKLGSMEDVTDDVICNDEEISGVALLLSDIEEDMLMNEDCDADADTLDDDDVDGEPDSEVIDVEDIDVSGDVEVEEDTEAECDNVVSVLLDGIGVDETLKDEDEEGELVNDASDEKEIEEETLEVGSGLFEEETEEVGEVLSLKNDVALIEAG